MKHIKTFLLHTKTCEKHKINYINVNRYARLYTVYLNANSRQLYSQSARFEKKCKKKKCFKEWELL